MSEYEERIARVVWAARILSCLTKKRSHIGLHQQPDAAKGAELEQADEEEGLDSAEVDAKSDRAACLESSRDSIRSQFLDCIAQLLSPNTGWEYVVATALREREDSVEVDVARNDCFCMNIASDCSSGRGTVELGMAEKEYFRELEYYLSNGTQQGKRQVRIILAYSLK
jgi:hypothetical protein